MTVLYDRARTLKGNVAFNLTHRNEDGKVTLRVRCALRDREHYLLGVTFGTTDFLLACNDDGMWYRAPDRNAITRAKKPVALPPVRLVMKQEGNSIFFNTETDPDAADGPLLSIPPTTPVFLAEKFKDVGHVHCERHRDAGGRAGTVFLRRDPTEWPDESATTSEVELDAHSMIREVRLVHEDKGKRSVLVLSDIVLGDELPADALKVTVPEGLEVREVEEISEAEIWANVFRLFAGIADSLKTECKK
jgi:hypothetical protein